MTDVVKARLMLVALCLAWGLTWPAMRIALIDLPPFTMRAVAALIGAGAMFVLAAFAGRAVRVPPRPVWGYIFIVSFFNIIMFSVCVAFAQLHTMTGRVAILVYTMPIWASIGSWFVLAERLTRYTISALVLCCLGMGVLVYPLAQAGIPVGIILALCAAFSWTIGTIYIKKSKIVIEPFTLAAWQLVCSSVFMVLLMIGFEPSLDLSAISWKAWAGVAFSGLFGSAVAYFLWFSIIRLLPTSTASLGVLSSPVIGLVSSVFLVGEIPTISDIAGFALIFAASFLALLQPQRPLPPSREAALVGTD